MRSKIWKECKECKFKFIDKDDNTSDCARCGSENIDWEKLDIKIREVDMNIKDIKKCINLAECANCIYAEKKPSKPLMCGWDKERGVMTECCTVKDCGNFETEN